MSFLSRFVASALAVTLDKEDDVDREKRQSSTWRPAWPTEPADPLWRKWSSLREESIVESQYPYTSSTAGSGTDTETTIAWFRRLMLCSAEHNFRFVGVHSQSTFVFVQQHLWTDDVPQTLTRLDKEAASCVPTDSVCTLLDTATRELVQSISISDNVPGDWKRVFPNASHAIRPVECQFLDVMMTCSNPTDHDINRLRPGGWMIVFGFHAPLQGALQLSTFVQVIRRPRLIMSTTTTPGKQQDTIKSGSMAMISFVTTGSHAAHAHKHQTWAKQWAPAGTPRVVYTPLDFDPQWCKQHAAILYEPRGAGLWLWKPALVASTLSAASADIEFLVYCDAGSAFRMPWNDILRWFRADATRWCFVTELVFLERDWTAPSVLSALKHDAHPAERQFAATAFVLRVHAKETHEFVRTWHERCTHREWIAAPEPHRHDQSLLSITLKQMRVSPAAPFGATIAHRVFYENHTSSAKISDLPLHHNNENAVKTTTLPTATLPDRVLYIMHAPDTSNHTVKQTFDKLAADVTPACAQLIQVDVLDRQVLQKIMTANADHVWWIQSTVRCTGSWKDVLNSAVDLDTHDLWATHIEPYDSAKNGSWYHWNSVATTTHGELPALGQRKKSFMAIACLSRRLIRALCDASWTAFDELWVPTVAHLNQFSVANLPATMFGTPFQYAAFMSADEWNRSAHTMSTNRLYNPVS